MSNTKIKSSQFHGVVGHGTDGYFLVTNGDGSMSWISNVVNPVISSLSYPGSATAADPAGGETITITGTGFKTGATVTVGGTAAPSVSYVSATSLTITTPAKAAGDYDVVVTNTDGGTATSVNGISFNGIPSWTTAAGSLGTFASDTTISTITLQATEPDGGTITFSITNGALPTGLSLTGANIDGTTTLETADTLYTFTVTATDDETQTTPRTFTITVTKQFIGTENFTINTYTGNGSTQSIEGKIGTAADFNGSSSKITLPNSTKGIGETDSSFSFWVYPVSVSSGYEIVALLTNNDWIEIRYNSSGQFKIYPARQSNGTFIEFSAVTKAANNWYNIVITRDSATSTIKLYVDGSLVETNTSWDGTLTSAASSPNGLGANVSSNTLHFSGKIDQFRIFSKAISSSEVTTLYGENNTSTTKSTTDIFDDGSGVALYEFEKGAKDTGGVNGYIGAAGEFNGSSSYISSSNPFSGQSGNGQIYSISIWFKADSFSSQYPTLFKGRGTGETPPYVWLNASQIRFHGYRYGDATVSLNTNQWYHLVVIENNGVISGYLDGTSITFGNQLIWNQTNGANLFIGGDPNSSSYYWDGKIDQVRIFNKALSSSEITTLYGETSASATKSTTDIFDDGSAVALYELEGNALDTSRGAIDSGQSAVFNGSSSQITLPSALSDGATTDAGCISFWFNVGAEVTSSTANNEIMSFAFSGGATGKITLGSTTGNFSGETISVSSDITTQYTYSTTNIPAGWNHAVIQWNGSTTKWDIYINKIAHSTSTFGTNEQGKFALKFGNRSSFYYNGKLDQIRVYSSALSSADITNLYNETNVPTTNLVAHYKFDGNANDSAGSYNGTATSITYSDPAEYPKYNGTATNVSYAYDGTPTNVGFVGTSFQPDLVWIKPRSYADNNNLFDSIRGVTKQLISNNTSAESTQANTLQSFDSNGFTTGPDNNTNTNGSTYVAWCWKAGGSAVSNTDGTITSQVSANTDAGFSIVKWTTTSAAAWNVGHGLSSAPEMIISKTSSFGNSWEVYHKDVGTGKYLLLHSTAAAGTDAGAFSSVTNTTWTSYTTNTLATYIAYCFHSVDSYQKVGSYSGSGGAGNKQTLGFKPRFLMVKLTNGGGSWWIFDGSRTPNNPRNLTLRADTTDTDYTLDGVDFEDDGFSFNSLYFNESGSDFIYLAIA
jgi:hypothetical protein